MLPCVYTPPCTHKPYESARNISNPEKGAHKRTVDVDVQETGQATDFEGSFFSNSDLD